MRSATRLPSTSSTSGRGDCLDDLEHDHRLVDTLFACAWTTAADERRALIDAIDAALSAHAELEETLVYPAIADAVTGGDVLVDRARAEHAQIKALLAGLTDADTSTIDEDLRALQVAVLQHVAAEEAFVFPGIDAGVRAGSAHRRVGDVRRRCTLKRPNREPVPGVRLP
jgi:hemerythrin superfamily protein